MHELDRDREAPRARREPVAEPAGQRDAQRPQVLAAEIEEVMRGAMHRACAARDHVELALERTEVFADPAVERGEPLGQRRNAPQRADARETGEDGGRAVVDGELVHGCP